MFRNIDFVGGGSIAFGEPGDLWEVLFQVAKECGWAYG
jgi:hypothetical protein